MDWQEVSAPDPHRLTIRGQQVPYVVFDNYDDVTTPRGEELGKRLEGCLERLWESYSFKVINRVVDWDDYLN